MLAENKDIYESNFKGIIPPLVTPFTADGNIDEEALRSEARFLLKSGVHGLSFGGSTGEGALLSGPELEQGIRILREENQKGVPLICGIIRNFSRDAIRDGLAARDAGANGLMVTPTYYHGTDDNGNIAYFRSLSDAVQIPIIIYNVIDRNPISPELMLRLIEIKHVVGIKQSVGGLHGFNAMIAACGEQTQVFGAQDDMLFCSYLLGAAGAISAILTVFPELCVRQWQMIHAGNIEEAKTIHFRLLPIWQLIIAAGMSFPGRIKSILKLLGRNGGFPRHPILETSADTVEKLKVLLEKADLLPEY
jgi:dihydrodipicolinate synthase/N-acetylneuraminate lyase